MYTGQLDPGQTFAACAPRTHRVRVLGTELRARPERLAGRQLTAICDQRPDRLEMVRQRYRAVAICGSLDEVLRATMSTRWSIATPASTHEAIVRAALDSGRHVLVEKPMALARGRLRGSCAIWRTRPAAC